MKDIIKKITANDSTLKSVSLDSKKLSNENVKYLFESLKANTHVKKLSLKKNSFDEKCVEFFCNMIRANKTIER